MTPSSARARPGGAGLGLFGGLGLGGAGLLALVPVVLALELLDPAGGVDVLHLAREEGMASGTDFHGDILPGAARDELVAAAAGHRPLFVFRMNLVFHGRLQ